jgi:glycosyltransferase involved in cell wall biosynthesis
VDFVVYTSPQHLETLDEYYFPHAKRRKIFYGLDVTPDTTLTDYKDGEKLKLVMIARGIKEKGWQEAIESVIDLANKYTGQLELNLVGQGEYLASLKEIYTQPFIHFSGYKENVLDYIRGAHIGLLPTYYVAESLPNTVIEYLLIGKPVISTNAGAIPDMITVQRETAGICINIEEGGLQVKELKAAIEKYLTNPSLVAAHSQLALVAAKKFGMEECVKSYEEIFGIIKEKDSKERA